MMALSRSRTLDELNDGLEQLGIGRARELADRLVAYGQLLLEENKSTNLVGAKSLADLIGAHFLDSLAVVKSIRLESPVVDVGSGAGLPGIPLALAFPKLQVVLLEPRTKRAAFLQRACDALNIPNVAVEKMSAGKAAAAGWKNTIKVALARALGSPSVALKAVVPLLAPGGRLAIYQGRAARPSSDDLRIGHELGCDLEKAERIYVPYLDAVRHIWVFKRRGPPKASAASH